MSEISIPELVFEFFRLCKLQPIEIRKGIWQVHLPEPLAKELDGWRAKERLFQFTFEKKLADAYGAELISPGSYRLDTILTAIRKQATLTHAHLPLDVFYEPTIRRKVLHQLEATLSSARLYLLNQTTTYVTYLFLVMRISFITHQMSEIIETPVVDLSTGRVSSCAIPMHLLRPGSPDDPIERRKVTYKKAYSNANNYITNMLSQQDDSWAKQAWLKLEDEQAKLTTYYENEPNSETQVAKAKELLKRTAPRVQIRPLRAALLYIPLYRYRIMQAGPTEKIHQVSYDPIGNNLELPT